MAWEHMPDYLIEDHVRARRLVDISNEGMRGDTVELVAARRRNGPHGPVASRLWRYLGEQAPSFKKGGYAVPFRTVG